LEISTGRTRQKKVRRLKKKNKIPDIHHLRPALAQARRQRYEAPLPEEKEEEEGGGGKEKADGTENDGFRDPKDEDESNIDGLPPLIQSEYDDEECVEEALDLEGLEEDIEFLAPALGFPERNKEPVIAERPIVMINTLGMNESRKLRSSHEVYRPGTAKAPEIRSSYMKDRRRNRAQAFHNSFRPSTSPTPISNNSLKLQDIHQRPATASPKLLNQGNSRSQASFSLSPVVRPKTSATVGRSTSSNDMRLQKKSLAHSQSFGNDTLPQDSFERSSSHNRPKTAQIGSRSRPRTRSKSPKR